MGRELDKYLRDYEKAEGKRNARIHKITEESNACMAASKERADVLIRKLRAFAEAHRDELMTTKREKSFPMPNGGTSQWSSSTSLEIRDEKATIEALKAIEHLECIKVVETVLKNPLNKLLTEKPELSKMFPDVSKQTTERFTYTPGRLHYKMRYDITRDQSSIVPVEETKPV
jgi:phage host-nuclease inhibitor protein Gam